MIYWDQHWRSSETETSAASYRYSVDLGDGVVERFTTSEVMRALCHLILEYLPAEELPYTTDHLMERGGDYFPELRGWQELSADEAEGAWVALGRGDAERLRLPSGS